ncbi:TyrS-associated PheT N-terminal domain-related protein TapR [Mycoplasma simbae]|uniref:TyrS-associated PheT N-terminal domain-related protein TapR n=1 Tax=Mycoplasma simbae TaxID=36744 RepID=UPI0012ECA812|nr:hypothetical protein [Mycoplasma simbae]
MAILINYDKEFKNTFEVIYDASVVATDYEVIESGDAKYVIHFRDSDFSVSSIIITDPTIKLASKTWGILPAKLGTLVENFIVSQSSRHYRFKDYANIEIGKIIERENHPKSEKLFVLRVDFGYSTKTIITNTLYTTVGKYLAWYANGIITPDGTVIKTGEVMNVASEAMLCSATSLNLPKYEDEFKNDVLSSVDLSKKDKYLGSTIELFYPELIFEYSEA